MILSTTQVANEIIACELERGGATAQRIHKLIYIMQGLALAAPSGKALPFTLNTMPEAWQYGPIYRDLYKIMKSRLNNPNLKPIKRFGLFTPRIPQGAIETREYVRDIVLSTREHSDHQLANLCASIAWKDYVDEEDTTISQHAMRREFQLTPWTDTPIPA